MKIVAQTEKDHFLIISVAVAKAIFDQELVKQQQKIVATIATDGYRRGKVPFAVGLKRFTKDHFEHAHNETTKVIIKQMEAYLKTAEVEIDALEVVSKVENARFSDELFIIDFWFEKPPVIELPDYENFKPDFDFKATVTVTAEEVAKEKDKIFLKNASLMTKTTVAADGDVVVIDFQGYLAGVALAQAAAVDFELRLGSKTFVGDFEQQLIGVGVNTTKTITVLFPTDYHEGNLAGQQVSFEVLVKAVKAVVLPTLDGPFFQALNLENVIDEASLEAFLQQKILLHKQNQQNEKAKKQIIEFLITGSKFSHLPQSLIQQEAFDNIKQLQANVDQEYKGGWKRFVLEKKVEAEKLIHDVYQETTARVQLFFIFETIAHKNGIELREGDEKAFFAEICQNFGVEANKYFEGFDPVTIKEIILQKKVINHLLQRFQI